ncbi:UNKNOWN [Stylonychia lemnae]|uniref:Uncharacterized protein n=1 Tax=Stylonychia lemnae TaxID=5949 RepID=A0A078AQD4_STYLE|nr:UNKNOWN [Stylonychia lemnae]|eukprot:CDW84161.1 UNKNOWN [Stylonychia lemnae]
MVINFYISESGYKLDNIDQISRPIEAIPYLADLFQIEDHNIVQEAVQFVNAKDGQILDLNDLIDRPTSDTEQIEKIYIFCKQSKLNKNTIPFLLKNQVKQINLRTDKLNNFEIQQFAQRYKIQPDKLKSLIKDSSFTNISQYYNNALLVQQVALKFSRSNQIIEKYLRKMIEQEELISSEKVFQAKINHQIQLIDQFDQNLEILQNIQIGQNRKISDYFNSDKLKEKRHKIQKKNQKMQEMLNAYTTLLQNGRQQIEKLINPVIELRKENQFDQKVMIIQEQSQNMKACISRIEDFSNKITNQHIASLVKNYNGQPLMLADFIKQVHILQQQINSESSMGKDIIERLIQTISSQERQQQERYIELNKQIKELQQNLMKEIDYSRTKVIKKLKEFNSQNPFLLLPKKLPESYNLSLEELERRKTFNIFLAYICEKLRAFSQQERDRRQNFNQANGIYLPKSLLPQIADPMPDFTFVMPSNFNLEMHSDDLKKYKGSIERLIMNTFELGFGQEKEGRQNQQNNLVNYQEIQTLKEQYEKKILQQDQKILEDKARIQELEQSIKEQGKYIKSIEEYKKYYEDLEKVIIALNECVQKADQADNKEFNDYQEQINKLNQMQINNSLSQSTVFKNFQQKKLKERCKLMILYVEDCLNRYLEHKETLDELNYRQEAVNKLIQIIEDVKIVISDYIFESETYHDKNQIDDEIRLKIQESGMDVDQDFFKNQDERDLNYEEEYIKNGLLIIRKIINQNMIKYIKLKLEYDDFKKDQLENIDKEVNFLFQDQTKCLKYMDKPMIKDEVLFICTEDCKYRAFIDQKEGEIQYLLNLNDSNMLLSLDKIPKIVRGKIYSIEQLRDINEGFTYYSCQANLNFLGNDV